MQILNQPDLQKLCGHVTDKRCLKSMLPNTHNEIFNVARDHPWALAVWDNNKAMAL